MTVTLPIDVGDETRVFLVPRHGTEYGSVGVVADVVERVRLSGGGHAVVLTGRERGVAGAARTDTNGDLRVEVEPRPDVILPERNRGDLDEVPADVRNQLVFHPVETIDAVLALALELAPAALAA